MSHSDQAIIEKQRARARGIVGCISYASGECHYFENAQAYLKEFREELPYFPTSGFRFETITRDPQVRKTVDDMLFNLYGVDNPRTLESYEESRVEKNEGVNDMKNNYPTREQVAAIKEQYPVGTRICLNSMSDPYAPIPEGTEGTVTYVDSMGTLGMKWDNGRTLGVVPFEDSFTVLSYPEQTLEPQMQMGGIS